MSGKIKMSVCRGHELANALYIYIYDSYYIRSNVYVFLYSVKKRVFDLEGDLVGVPGAWYLSAQFFITLLKLV